MDRRSDVGGRTSEVGFKKEEDISHRHTQTEGRRWIFLRGTSPQERLPCLRHVIVWPEGHDNFLPCRSHGKKHYKSVFMSAFMSNEVGGWKIFNRPLRLTKADKGRDGRFSCGGLPRRKGCHAFGIQEFGRKACGNRISAREKSKKNVPPAALDGSS